MRRIVAGLAISLDGVVESPADWILLDDELAAVINAGVAQADAVLLGRRTYLEFAKLWPTQGSDVPMADFLNNSPKHIVSSTLDTLEWANSTLVTGDLAEEIAKLKEQPDSNIQIPGSPTLVRSLLRDGLLDELHLLVHPLVVGAGKRLFDGETGKVPLKLLSSKTFGTGVVYLVYGRGSEPSA
jgi:dihydrofolate reductase